MKNREELKVFLGLIAIAVLCIIFAVIKQEQKKDHLVYKQRHTLQKEILKESEEELNANKFETFAVFGVDSRDKDQNQHTRSDTIMVVCIDRENKKVKIASIYRDSYVLIKKRGFDKITHAYAFGGVQLAVDTLNYNFDLDITKYLVVNFSNVTELVDRLGGVKINITESELKYINGYIDEINHINKTKDRHITKTGMQLLNGTQAVAYSRIRYTTGGEYKRAWRQQEVLMKLFESMKDKKDQELFKALSPMLNKIENNCDVNDLTDLFSCMKEYQVKRSSYPKKLWGGKIDGIWYAVPVTLENTAKGLHEYLYDEDYDASETVKTISDKIKQQKSEANEEPDEEIE